LPKEEKRRNTKNSSALFLQSLTIQKVYLKEIKIKDEKRELSLPTFISESGSLSGLSLPSYMLMCLY
jgi:hypothetical protein